MVVVVVAWLRLGASIKLAIEGDALALVYRGASGFGGVAERVGTGYNPMRGE